MKSKGIRELVTDVHFDSVQIGDQTYTKVTGVAKRANHINLNRRYYSRDALSKAVDKASAMIKEGGLNGLMDHPGFFEGSKGSPKNTAIKWTDVKMQGDDVIVEGIVLKTAVGKDLQALIDAKVKIDLSTNVKGKTRYVRASEVDSTYQPKDAFVQVFDDLTFNTIDVVGDGADEYASLTMDALKEGIKTMTLEELKKDNPELYDAVLQEAAAKVEKSPKSSEGDDKILDEMVKLRKELDEERKLRLEAERRSLVDNLLAEAKLPELGKVSDIDLDARLRARLEDAALTAEDEKAARAAVSDIIAEQRALLGVGGDPQSKGGRSEDQSVGVRKGDNSAKQDAKTLNDRPTVASARGSFGL